MEFNAEMSRKYGVKIYNSGNERFPYHAEELFEDESECCTEAEIKDFVNHHRDGAHTPWANSIAGWYGDVKGKPERHPELIDIIDEISLYLETMYGVKETNGYPGWVRNYLDDLSENCDAPDDTWMIPVIDRVIEHL